MEQELPDTVTNDKFLPTTEVTSGVMLGKCLKCVMAAEAQQD